MGKTNIPQSVIDSTLDAVRDWDARVEYLGIYKGRDAYALLYPDDMDVGYPDVFICNRDGSIDQCLEGEDALMVIGSFDFKN